MKTLSLLVPAVLILGAALAACGGSDSNAQPESTTTPRASATARVTPAAPSATAAVESPETAPTEAPAAATATPVAGQPQGGQPTMPPPPLPPPAATNTPVPPPPPPPQGQFLTIAAKDTRFNPSQLGVQNGGTVTITFDNQDAGVAHDLIVYSPAGGIAGQSPVIVGASQATFAFTPSGAGNYFFKCSLHPQYMTGTIAVAP
jgi:plastocyanin